MAERKRKTADKENDGRMSLAEKTEYVHEPTDLQCGQAVLAMLTGIDVGKVAEILGNDRETKLSEMKDFLMANGILLAGTRCEARSAEDLPDIALLSLETPRCWHWSLFAHGTFYDPEHGVMQGFPECARKYYWEVKNIENQ